MEKYVHMLVTCIFARCSKWALFQKIPDAFNAKTEKILVTI